MIDLHMHSTYSDGNKNVQEIVAMSKENNIQTISLTDHNTIKGLDTLKKQNIDYIDGVEFYSFKKNVHGFHMLAYDFNVDSNFLELMNELEYERYASMKKKIDLINEEFNMNLHVEELDQTWLSNHTLFMYIKDKYDISTAREISEFISKSGIKIIRKVDYLRLLKVILCSGGIPVLAHPKSVKCEDVDLFLKDLVNHGLMGIEVYHPSHEINDITKYLEYAEKYKLLISGGSDYHGYNKTNVYGNEVKLGYFNNEEMLNDVSILKYIRGR